MASRTEPQAHLAARVDAAVPVNNLQLTSVIFAILAIGVIGVMLDAGLGRLSRRLAYSD